MRFLVFLFLVVTSPVLLAQNKRVVVVGSVNDKDTGSPIEGVNVTISGSTVGASTNRKGNFILKLWNSRKYKFVITHVGYQALYTERDLSGYAKDTLYLKYTMKSVSFELDSFSVEAEKKPIVVYKSTRVSVSDFEFYEDGLVLLTYEKRLEKGAELILTDYEQQEESRIQVPGEASELYRDYLGNVNLICENKVYRITTGAYGLELIEIPVKDFYDLIKPCVDTLQNQIIFSDFLKQFPKFKYYLYTPADTTAQVLREIVDEGLAHAYHFEYYSLSNAQKAYALRLASRLKGYDEYDVAAAMTGFANDFMYEPLFAPLFTINDTMYVFDHYDGVMAKYVGDTTLAEEDEISYHKPRQWKEWKKQMFFDEVTHRIYALFQKKGHYQLKEISRANGQIVKTMKLTHKYVEEIKVMDGFVYYVYRPYESLQKKFLYKEKI